MILGIPVGNPPINMFAVEWYATRLDAMLRIQQLPDTDRLPRPVWIPSVPDTSMGAEVLQDGVLRLYPPISETPYETAVGVLCVNQEDIHEDGDPKNIDVDAINVRQRLCVCPNWEDA